MMKLLFGTSDEHVRRRIAAVVLRGESAENTDSDVGLPTSDRAIKAGAPSGKLIANISTPGGCNSDVLGLFCNRVSPRARCDRISKQRGHRF